MQFKKVLATLLLFLSCCFSGCGKASDAITDNQANDKTQSRSVQNLKTDEEFDGFGMWGEPCKNSKTQTLQDMINSKTIGSIYLPKDIDFKKDKKDYVSLRATTVYYWPQKDKKYLLFDLRRKFFGGGSRIRAVCSFTDASGTNWLVFRWKPDHGILYVDKSDFVLDQ